jgi:hypothetical protein
MLQKRVNALNRDLPPRDEQFIADYDQEVKLML